MLDLVAQAAQHIARQARVVVLNEADWSANRLVKLALVEAHEEEPAPVPEYARLEQDEVCNGKWCSFHQKMVSFRMRSKYSP